MIENKAHLIFPSDLLKEIDKLVGKRKRSKFVAEAAIKELKRLKLSKAIEEAAGSWKDEDHTELVEKGTSGWVRELRKEKEKRVKEISN